MDKTPLTKLYYTVGEVAKRFDLAPSVLRYWESEFPQLKPGKNSKGDRKYTPKDIEIIEKIYDLVKNKGFTINGARLALQEAVVENKDKNLLLQKLMKIKKRVENIKKQLEE